MRGHKWVEVGHLLWKCSRDGCTVRRSGDEDAGLWQRKEGAHWRRVTRQPTPECAGKDDTPHQPTPSPLARVRWALERVRDDSLMPVHEALDALTTLEAALPDLMDAWHYTMPHERGPDGWRGCRDCLAKLESK